MNKRYLLGEKMVRAEELPTINITRKERASIAFQKTRARAAEEIAAFERGYEAAEWDFEMASMGMRRF